MEEVNISFVIGNKTVNIQATQGQSILDIKHYHKPLLDEIECACEGSVACSTCHLIIDPAFYAKTIAEVPISDEENDMLDLATGLTKTSRLGCQVKINSSMEGMIITVPNKYR